MKYKFIYIFSISKWSLDIKTETKCFVKLELLAWDSRWSLDNKIPEIGFSWGFCINPPGCHSMMSQNMLDESDTGPKQKLEACLLSAGDPIFSLTMEGALLSRVVPVYTNTNSPLVIAVACYCMSEIKDAVIWKGHFHFGQRGLMREIISSGSALQYGVTDTRQNRAGNRVTRHSSHSIVFLWLHIYKVVLVLINMKSKDNLNLYGIFFS